MPNWADRGRFFPRTPWDYLDEQEITDLLHRAGSRTIDPTCAQVLVAALATLAKRPHLQLEKCLTVIQPAPGGAPDLLVVDDQYRVHVVIEVKVAAHSHKQSDGRWQVEAYEDRDANYLKPTAGRAPKASYILLDAGNKSSVHGRRVADAFPGANLREPWSTVGMRDLANQLVADSHTVPDSEAGRYLRHVAAELAAAADRMADRVPDETSGPVTDVLLRALVDADSRYPTPPAAELGARLAAALRAGDVNHKMDTHRMWIVVSDGEEVEYCWRPDAWVAHRLTYRDMILWLGVPDPKWEAPARHRGAMVPLIAGPLGRVYVVVNQGWDTDRAAQVTAAMGKAGLSPLAYNPWEYDLDDNEKALGFWGFHPLLGTGTLLESYHRAMVAVVVSVTQEMSRQ